MGVGRASPESWGKVGLIKEVGKLIEPILSEAVCAPSGDPCSQWLNRRLRSQMVWTPHTDHLRWPFEWKWRAPKAGGISKGPALVTPGTYCPPQVLVPQGGSVSFVERGHWDEDFRLCC